MDRRDGLFVIILLISFILLNYLYPISLPQQPSSQPPPPSPSSSQPSTRYYLSVRLYRTIYRLGETVKGTIYSSPNKYVYIELKNPFNKIVYSKTVKSSGKISLNIYLSKSWKTGKYRLKILLKNTDKQYTTYLSIIEPYTPPQPSPPPSQSTTPPPSSGTTPSKTTKSKITIPSKFNIDCSNQEYKNQIKNALNHAIDVSERLGYASRGYGVLDVKVKDLSGYRWRGVTSASGKITIDDSLSGSLLYGVVSHELFHYVQYQYGHTYPKEDWFIEGTAEGFALYSVTDYIEPMHPNKYIQTMEADFYSRSYDACVFWYWILLKHPNILKKILIEAPQKISVKNAFQKYVSPTLMLQFYQDWINGKIPKINQPKISSKNIGDIKGYIGFYGAKIISINHIGTLKFTNKIPDNALIQIISNGKTYILDNKQPKSITLSGKTIIIILGKTSGRHGYWLEIKQTTLAIMLNISEKQPIQIPLTQILLITTIITTIYILKKKIIKY